MKVVYTLLDRIYASFFLMFHLKVTSPYDWLVSYAKWRNLKRHDWQINFSSISAVTRTCLNSTFSKNLLVDIRCSTSKTVNHVSYQDANVSQDLCWCVIFIFDINWNVKICCEVLIASVIFSTHIYNMEGKSSIQCVRFFTFACQFKMTGRFWNWYFYHQIIATLL